MAKLTALPHQAIISGFKGKIDFYLYMGIPVARKWPRSPGHRRALSVEAQWPAFTIASRLWGEMSEQLQMAYSETATGTNMSGRDLSAKAYLSGYLKS
ncbi:unnamed protein product [marine sediment metagenome]|uniref:Uncharacterized protein n=1 Tax=marine sediment metagenome TaxID=412755 RepID=X1TL66_9ZZZZ